MPSGLHEISDDGFLTQLLARFQTMQPFHQDQTFTVLPHQDRVLQADLEDTLGDLLRLLGIERRPPLHRHVLQDVSQAGRRVRGAILIVLNSGQGPDMGRTTN